MLEMITAVIAVTDNMTLLTAMLWLVRLKSHDTGISIVYNPATSASVWCKAPKSPLIDP